MNMYIVGGVVAACLIVGAFVFTVRRHFEPRFWKLGTLGSLVVSTIWLAAFLVYHSHWQLVLAVFLAYLLAVMVVAVAGKTVRALFAVPFVPWLVSLLHVDGSDLTARHYVEDVIGLSAPTTDSKGHVRRDYEAWCEQDDGDVCTIRFQCSKAGVVDDYVDAKVRAAVDAMGAVACDVGKVRPADWRIRYYRTTPPSLLDATVDIGHVQAWHGQGTRLRLGRDADGQPVELDFANLSGVVLGGLAGAGKTVAAQDIVAPLLTDPSWAQVNIIDGKGAGDWSFAHPTAYRFYAGDVESADVVEARLERLRRICDLLDECQEQMEQDLRFYAEWPQRDPNFTTFWESREKFMLPMHVLLIDECQTIFNTAGMGKEEKAVAMRCTALVDDIVRRGRAAGWLVILITQKPTAESIPTTIRDNCAVRICLRVGTVEAARAVLGSLPDGAPSPLQIPRKRVGGAIMVNDEGDAIEFRFDHMTHEAAKRAVVAPPVI